MLPIGNNNESLNSESLTMHYGKTAVTFDLSGGSCEGEENGKYIVSGNGGETLTAPTATKDGMIFYAWLDKDGNKVKFPATFPEQDVTYTALYRTEDERVELNGEFYKTLTDALEAAQSGDTLTLAEDIVGEPFLAIESGVTLDLNGHSITGAKFLYVTGGIVDNAPVEQRGVLRASVYFFDKQSQTMTPVYNAEKGGYSLFTLAYSSTNTLYDSQDKKIKFSLAPGERNAAWGLLTGDEYTRYFKVVLHVTWLSEDAENERNFSWNKGFIDRVVKDQLSGNGARFTASITGAAAGATAQPKFVICDANGAEIFSFDGPVFAFDGTSWTKQ